MSCPAQQVMKHIALPAALPSNFGQARLAAAVRRVDQTAYTCPWLDSSFDRDIEVMVSSQRCLLCVHLMHHEVL